MKVRTVTDPEHGLASITFPINHMDKGECSVERSIRVSLPTGELLIDVNFKGQLLGLEIMDYDKMCTEDTIQALLEGK